MIEHDQPSPVCFGIPTCATSYIIPSTFLIPNPSLFVQSQLFIVPWLFWDRLQRYYCLFIVSSYDLLVAVYPMCNATQAMDLDCLVASNIIKPSHIF
jgi:hypothetical protein